MNLFGRLFAVSLLSIFAIDIISFLSFSYPDIQLVVFISIIIIVFAATLYKVEYGLYIILAELFIGGKGHLFSIQTDTSLISIRIALFLIILGIWLGKKIQNKEKRIYFKDPFIKLFIILLAFIGYGFIHGLINNSFGAVFFDFNAWIFFLLFFVFYDTFTEKKYIFSILQVLLAAVSWIGIKTVIVFYLFSQNITSVGDFFYTWIRDTGVGEITAITDSLHRIFFQSHIYSLIAMIIILVIVYSGIKIKLRDAVGLGLILYLTSLTVVMSQSRSFFAAGLAVFASLIIYSFVLHNKFLSVVTKSIIVIVIVLSQIWLVNTERITNIGQDAAGSSRLNQLNPLIQAISHNALLGSGFGTEVTYVSNDPRIQKTHPGGWYTTYSFEWGYLDIALKIGLLGLGAYLTFIGYIFYQGFKNRKNSSVIVHGFLFGLMALCVVNIFTPYLNHPLGIGYIMLVSTLIMNPVRDTISNGVNTKKSPTPM